MGNAGTKSFIIRDSSMNTEIYVDGSSRADESAWEITNSSISGSPRVKRDTGLLTIPLPGNVTIVDNNLFNVPEVVDMLWILIVINALLFSIVLIQIGKYQNCTKKPSPIEKST